MQKKIGPAWSDRGRAPAGFTKHLAQAWLRDVLDEARRGTLPGMVRSGATFADAAAAVIGSLRVEDPPASGPTPRAHALAILENFHSNLRATPALGILGSLLTEEERHPELLHLFKTRLVEPRRTLLRQALAAGEFPESADLDALTSMLIGSFYGRYLTLAGIPEDWSERVLNAIWPQDPRAAPGRHDHNA